MIENVTKSPKIDKPRREYHRKPAPPAPPPPPNPTILALQNEILKLVGQRPEVNQEIATANGDAVQASARVQAAHQKLQNLEREVQYRLGLISQMQGGGPAPMTTITYSGTPDMGVIGAIPPGVGSIPTPAMPQRVVATGPRIRSESAEGVRAEEVGARAI